MKKNAGHIRRGDIYYADLRPAIGSEQDGIRPVLVIQNNAGNRHSPTVIAAAITARQTKAHLPTHVTVGKVPGMNSRSIVMLEQVRTIDKQKGYRRHALQSNPIPPTRPSQRSVAAR